jgi:hypothetical protein
MEAPPVGIDQTSSDISPAPFEHSQANDPHDAGIDQHHVEGSAGATAAREQRIARENARRRDFLWFTFGALLHLIAIGGLLIVFAMRSNQAPPPRPSPSPLPPPSPHKQRPGGFRPGVVASLVPSRLDSFSPPA